MDGPGCFNGYRNIWHTLQRKGMRVPRSAVEETVRGLDPEYIKSAEIYLSSDLY